MIRRSQKLAVARWWVTVATVVVAVIVMSLHKPGDTEILSAMAGFLSAAGGVMFAMLQWSNFLNRGLVQRLTGSEKREIIRLFGRPNPLPYQLGYGDLVLHILRSLTSRSELSEAEWQIITEIAVPSEFRLGRASAAALRRAEVVEVEAWLKKQPTWPARTPSRVRSLVEDLSRFPHRLRESLPPFAPRQAHPFRVKDILRACEDEFVFLLMSLGAILILVGHTIASLFAGTCSIVPLSFAAAGCILTFTEILNRARAPHSDPPGPDVLPELIDQFRQASGGREIWIRRNAVVYAARATSDFSQMSANHFAALLEILGRSLVFGREEVVQVLATFAPRELLPRVIEESDRWMASKSRRAPRHLRELTAIRLGMLRRLGENEPPALQEVP